MEKKRTRLALLALMLFSLAVGGGSGAMAAQNEAAGLTDEASPQVGSAEMATTGIEKMATTASMKKQIRQVTGFVTSISGSHFTVKKGVKTFDFQVGEGIVIKSDDTKKSLADLKVGDKVMTKYVETGGVRIARSIYLKNRR